MAGIEQLGRYQIRGALGRGGFATVYRVYDPMLDREVALKALLPHLAEDNGVRARFLSEARAIARLHHANIVTIYEAGEADERPFYAMELIEGGTLGDLLAREGRLHLARVAAIIRDLAAAVGYLHDAGIVHRDIKPANIMLGERGRVVLMDFGIARVLERTQFTRTGTTIGTPEYMAPEQALGRPVGPAADVYSLAMVAYHMLAGRPAFEGDTLPVLHAQAYEPPPPLRGLCPGLPSRVYAAIDAALVKDPSQRPASASSLAAALLGDLPAREPGPAGRPSAPPHLAAMPPPLPPTERIQRQTPPAGSGSPQQASRRRAPAIIGVGSVLAIGIVAAIVVAAAAAGGHRGSNNTSSADSSPAATRAAIAAVATSPGSAAPAAGSPVASASAAAIVTRVASPAATTSAESSAPAGASSSAAAAAATGGRPADAAPDDQQVLRLVNPEPETLDWQVSQFEQDIAVEHLLARGLFYFDKDANVVPALAVGVPSKDNGGVSADGLTYTIKMKPGQKFSDGNPLTAKDMVYTVQRALDPKLAGNYAGFFYDIVGGEAYNTALGTKDKPASPSDADLKTMRDALGVKAVDDLTLQLTLTKPSGSFLTRMALWAMYPVEQSVIEKFGDKWTDVGNLIGNGPFMLKENAPKDHITLVANPNYTLDPKPIIKTLVLREIDDANTQLNAYKNGELDETNVPSQQAQQVLNDPAYKDQIKRQPRQETRGLEFNNAAKPFDNPLVRLAFSKAVDRDAFVKVVYSGIGTSAATWMPPGLPGYDKANEDVLKYDPTAAKKALADAGFPNGQGFPTDVKIILTDTATNKALFDFVAKQLKDNLNVTIQSDIVDAKTRSSRYSNGQFSLFYGGWIGDYPNADDWLPDLWTTGGSTNKPKYTDPKFDLAVKAAFAEVDPKRQAPLWSAAEKIMLQDAAGGWLYHGEMVQLFKPKVKGMVNSSIDSSWYGSELFEYTYIVR